MVTIKLSKDLPVVLSFDGAVLELFRIFPAIASMSV